MTIPPRSLAELVREAGLVSSEALDALDAIARGDDRRLGSLLLEQRLISAARLAQVLSRQLSIPWVSLDKVSFDASLLGMIPVAVAVRHRVVPVYLRKTARGTTLYVATDDPTCEAALEACRAAAGLEVRPVVAAPDEVRRCIEAHYGTSSALAAKAADPGVAPIVSTHAPKARRPPLPSSPTVELGDDDVDLVIADDEAPVPGTPSDLVITDHEVPEPGPPSVDVGEEPADAPPRFELRQHVVMIVNPSHELAVESAILAASVGARVEAVSLEEVLDRARATTPAALVVPDEVYEFDRPGLNTLAIGLGVPLVVWSDAQDADDLEPVLAAALRARRDGE